MTKRRNPSAEDPEDDSGGNILDEQYAQYEVYIRRGMERALWVIAYRQWAEEHNVIEVIGRDAASLRDIYGERADIRALEMTWEQWDDRSPTPTPAALAAPLKAFADMVVEVNEAPHKYPLAILYLGALNADANEDGEGEFSVVPRSLDYMGYLPISPARPRAWRVGEIDGWVYTDQKKAQAKADSNRRIDTESDRRENRNWFVYGISDSEEDARWWERQEYKRIRDSRDEAIEFGNALVHMAAETGVSWFGSGVHNDSYTIRLRQFGCLFDGDRLYWTDGPEVGVPVVEIFDTTTRFGRLDVANARNRNGNDGGDGNAYVVAMGLGILSTPRLVMCFADSPEEALNWAMDWAARNAPGLLSNDEVGERANERRVMRAAETPPDEDIELDEEDYAFIDEGMISDDTGNYVRSETVAGYPSNQNFRALLPVEIRRLAFPDGEPT